MIGAASTGMLVGTIASLVALLPLAPEIAVRLVLLGAASVVVVMNLGGLGDRLPQNRRLVPASVIGKATTASALQFGFEMGTGLRTFSPSGPPLAAALVGTASGSLLAGLVVWLGFGIGRDAYAIGRNLVPEPERVDLALASLVDRAIPRAVSSIAMMAVVLAEVICVVTS